MSNIGKVQEGATIIHCDSNFAIAISKNSIFHRKTKHIKVKYHFAREAQNNCEVKLAEIDGEDQLADIFTKPLSKGIFEKLIGLQGMKHKSQGGVLVNETFSLPHLISLS